MGLTGEIITTAIKLVCLVAIFVVSRYLIPAIKETIGTDKLNELISWGTIFVQSVEQVLGAGSGKEKKELVTDYLTAKCQELGIDLSAIDIDAIIESCVYAMNESKKVEVTKDGD